MVKKMFSDCQSLLVHVEDEPILHVGIIIAYNIRIKMCLTNLSTLTTARLQIETVTDTP